MSKTHWEAADTEGVWITEANEAGPTVAIMGGVHGDEGGGSLVISESLFKVSIECGKLIAIQGNPRALDKRVRFTEVNLNRCFRELNEAGMGRDPEEWLYEVGRAQSLLPYLDESEALLDLHEHQYDGSKPFIICEPNAFSTARAIGAPVISFGWSETEPGGSDGYMFEQGKEGICYELGPKQKPTPNIKLGHEAVKRFLSVHGLIDEKLEPLYRSPKYVKALDTYIRNSPYYSLSRNYDCFEILSDEELIAVDDKRRIFAEGGDIIIFPDPDPQIGAEAFTIGRQVN